MNDKTRKSNKLVYLASIFALWLMFLAHRVISQKNPSLEESLLMHTICVVHLACLIYLAHMWTEINKA